MNREITLEVAEAILEAAKAKARELEIRAAIAIVDTSTHLQAFVRMDDAWLGSIDIAIRKARTARLTEMETSAIGKISQPGQPLYGIEQSNGGLIIFGGGIPLRDADGKVVGAVGVSGSTVDNDMKVAEAAVAACRWA